MLQKSEYTIHTIRQEVYIEIHEHKLKCLRTQVAENERPPMKMVWSATVRLREENGSLRFCHGSQSCRRKDE